WRRVLRTGRAGGGCRGKGGSRRDPRPARPQPRRNVCQRVQRTASDDGCPARVAEAVRSIVFDPGGCRMSADLLQARGELPIAKAINAGLRAAMANDERVLLMGEDIGPLGGVFRVTDGLQREFGSARVIDTPLAEAGIVGSAIGLAM